MAEVVNFPEFASDNEDGSNWRDYALPTFGLLCRLKDWYEAKERNYMESIQINTVKGDPVGNDYLIRHHLNLVSLFQKSRRRRNATLFYSRWLKFVPPVVEIHDCHKSSVALISRDYVQIKQTADLDAALHIINGNMDVERPPTFLLHDVDAWQKLQNRATGRFIYKIKCVHWPMDHRYGGKGDESKSVLMKIMDRHVRLMVVSSLNHTMVDQDDPDNLSLLSFNALWEAYYRSDSLLVFSTGMSSTLYNELRNERPLITPDIIIFSMGTEIRYGNEMVPDNEWFDLLNQKWDRDLVFEETRKFSKLTLQNETEQRPHKLSFHIEKDKADDVTKNLLSCLTEHGLDVQIIFSGSKNLDILPKGAGKGQALAYLLSKFRAEKKLPKHTLVCGDSESDSDLFSIPDAYGVMVRNAPEELHQLLRARNDPKIFHATERCARGVIQAIDFFKLGPSTSPRNNEDIPDFRISHLDLADKVVKFYWFYERWKRAKVSQSAVDLAKLKAHTSASGMFVHSGVEMRLRDYVGSITFGDQSVNPFYVWVDQVSVLQVASDTWLVMFKKNELRDGVRACYLTTAKFSSNGATGLTLMRVHQRSL